MFLVVLETKVSPLEAVSDVSCDCTSPDNPLPIYDTITTFVKPTHRLDMRWGK